MMFYVIRAGFSIYKNGLLYSGGQTIELSDFEFEQHKHKFENTVGSVFPIANVSPTLNNVSNTLQVEVGEDVKAGQVVFINPLGLASLAFGLSFSSAKAIGLALEDKNTGFAVAIETQTLTLESWLLVTGTQLLTPGATYYLSALRPGKLTTIAPSNGGALVAEVGQAVSQKRLLIEIQPLIQL